MARFGLLYLRKGGGKIKQIIPEAWVEKSAHADEVIKGEKGAERALSATLVFRKRKPRIADRAAHATA